MILTGARFDAPWALSRGLVNEVVSPSAVMPRALEIAELIARNAPVATQLSKRAVTASTDLALDEGLALERALSRQALGTWDAEEGPRAFAEKRAPKFRGK
jgi:enoyl-CoA hydratase/carnithine racemase